jgi:hypothetical protein
LIKDVNIRPKTMKLLQENTRNTFQDIDIGDKLPNRTPILKEIQARIDSGTVSN